MPSIYIIGVIAILIIGSFLMSAISYSRQQALKKKKQMVKHFQQQADEALSYLSVLLRIDKEYDVILQLQNLVINALSRALTLNPEDTMLQNHLNIQKVKLNEYKQAHRNNEIVCWVTSDAELTAMQTQIMNLNKLLDLYRNKGDLNFSRHQELQNHIQLLQQELTANTYLYQADLLAEQKNITSYQLYIKQAIQVIKKANIASDLKNKKIKVLSDRIQEVKRTGKVDGLENFIKPAESPLIDESQQPETTE